MSLFSRNVGSKPWVLSPDTNTGDLTKLCNHKRKIIAMASAVDRKPLDPNIKLRKDYNVKRKKRKIGLPYAAGGISVSHIFAQREKIALNQHGFNKDLIANQQQPSVMNRLHGYPETVGQPHQVVRCHQEQQPNRLMAAGGQPVVMAGADGSTIVVQQPPNPAQSIAHNHPNAGGQVIGSAAGGGPFVNVQSNQNGQQGAVNYVNATPGAGQGQSHHQQHRVYINGQPSEPSGPGRPNLQMIPVTVSNQPANQDMRRGAQNQPQNMQNIQFYSSPSNSVSTNPSQCPAQTHQAPPVRHFNPNMNGFRLKWLRMHKCNSKRYTGKTKWLLNINIINSRCTSNKWSRPI
nr:unnamed protein product [Callosobruchus analis]